MRRISTSRLIAGVLFLVTAGFALLFYWAMTCTSPGAWLEVYARDLRTPLFTGCLTVGSFLLTLKATILLRVKEVYDAPEYQKLFDAHCDQERRKRPGQEPPGYYDSFRNLGFALMASVVMALLAALMQLTVGMTGSPVGVSIALAFAATALIWLLFVWWQMARNLSVWFATLKRPERETKKTN